MLQISKYAPNLDYYIFTKANSVRQVLGLPRKTEYTLLAKNEHIDISQIDKDKHWRTPKSAVAFNYVKIGKKFNEDFSREIISFLDETGRIIERVFRENGANVKQRTYKYDKETRTIEHKTFDTSRICDDIKSQKARNIWGMWKKEYSEKQWIYKIKDILTKNGKPATLLRTKRTTNLSEDGTTRKITLTEFPLNKKLRGQRQKITASGIIEVRNHRVKLHKFEHSDNINLDENDEYLKFRFLDLFNPDGLKILGKHYIQKRGLAPLSLYIEPNSANVKPNSEACFSPATREIRFSPKVLKQYILDIIDTIAHEVEHAYQHSQIGRLGKGRCDYEFEAFRKFGEIENLEEREEALRYAIARENYPKLTDDEQKYRISDKLS